MAVIIEPCRTRGSLFRLSAQMPHAPVIAPIQGNRALRTGTKEDGISWSHTSWGSPNVCSI
ncbi:MAG: hypothetical protein JW882_19950 [Deltaproteobacteria bacterium]|nr:hypothetical protein [Deltaproteobacteria bacterium]